jgi:hypothetical protein
MALSRLFGGVIEGQETARLLSMKEAGIENMIRELVESAS